MKPPRWSYYNVTPQTLVDFLAHLASVAGVGPFRGIQVFRVTQRDGPTVGPFVPQGGAPSGTDG